MKRLSIKYIILITISILVTLLIISLLLLNLIFPNKMAFFANSIGLKNISQSLYFKDYKKNKNLSSLYNSLLLNISLNRSDKTINYFEILSDDDNYEVLINKLEENVFRSSNNNLVKANSINIKNYLQNEYIEALILEDNNIIALEKSVNFFENDNLTYNNLGNYTFSNFLNTIEKITKYKDYFSNNDSNLFKRIVNYYNDLVLIYDNIVLEQDSNISIYKIALINRIVLVGKNLLSLNNENKIIFSLDESKISDQILLNYLGDISELI